MCIGGGSPPAAPSPPPPPAPLPTKVAPEVVKARQDFRAQAALAGGRDGTILTTAQGLNTPAVTTGKKTVLGA